MNLFAAAGRSPRTSWDRRASLACFPPCGQAVGGVAPKTFRELFRLPGRDDFKKNGGGSEPVGQSHRSVRSYHAYRR